MSKRVYRVVDVFLTLQGEGANSGRAAVFVRFSTCNLWNGRHKDRARDAARMGALCPKFCDTSFAAGEPMNAEQLCDLVRARASLCREGSPMIVLTGGEPALQFDEQLEFALRQAMPGSMLAIETNGTKELMAPVDWVCVSPKTVEDRIVIRSGNELKLVYPTYDPEDYAHLSEQFEHLWLSPMAETTSVGVSKVSEQNVRATAGRCMSSSRWRMSMQMHKLAGLS